MDDTVRPAKHIRIGKLGEDIAAKWLADKGHALLERNYNKKWGELDIVTRKDGEVHFVEVKAISHETREVLEKYVSCGTSGPEENVHAKKRQRLARAIQTWIAGRKYVGDFQIDVLTVRLVPREKFAVVELIENVIFE
jgi:putative endonuclease